MRFILPALLLLAACAAHPPATPLPDGITVASIPVPLNPDSAAQDRIGRLRYMGGISLSSTDRRFGGLSALRWDAGGLLSIGDTGTIVALTPREDGSGRLLGIVSARLAPLRDPAGAVLEGKAMADAESLTGDGEGGWLVGFEHQHRVWRYRRFGGPAESTGILPETLLGPLEPNNGVEALAGTLARPLLCAERQAAPAKPNCFGGGKPFSVAPPPEIARLGGVPTDMDELGPGHLLVLFRSFSLMAGAGAAVIEHLPDGSERPVATLLPPLTLDNMEGLAVRREGARTFVYLISDDNFSPLERTLLMKFELLP